MTPRMVLGQRGNPSHPILDMRPVGQSTAIGGNPLSIEPECAGGRHVKAEVLPPLHTSDLASQEMEYIFPALFAAAVDVALQPSHRNVPLP